MIKIFTTNSYLETMDFAEKFAKILPNGSVIAMNGDLGAGKTTFTRGVAKALKITDIIQSPTFNIMKIYLKGERPLIHIDAYRLADLNTDIGLDEFIGYETGLTLIEWPEYIADLLPIETIKIEIKNIGENARKFTVDIPDELEVNF
jgi:tRNA threonylcarbamoyladenosine biosynthesis protein TsaE